MESLDTARELATHTVEIRHIQEDMDQLVKDIDEIKKSLAGIQKTLSEAKGGWKVLLMVGGAGGVLFTALQQVFHWFGGR